MKARTLGLVAIMTLGALLTAAGCTSNKGSGTTGAGGAGGGSVGTGGPVSGPVDMHCAGKPAQPTSQASCHPDAGAMGAGGSGTGGSGGATSPYGATMDNAEGDDDDCKYHVKWTATPIGENENVTFTVVATNKTDGTPVVGAAPPGYSMAELYLSDIHPGPNTDQKAIEGPPGTYKVGPLRFDAPGKWTLRFHLFEDCSDLNDDSPHGHAAFFVQVP